MDKFSFFVSYKNTVIHSVCKTVFLLIFIGLGFLSSAQSAGFQDNEFQGGFDGINGITFDAAGRAFAWQKDGKLYCRTLNGTWHELLNIGDEINVATDSGLKGFALHPNFLSNGFIYLLYEVDRHHLMNFGTITYDSLTNDYLNASIGRITRYTINTSNFESIIPNSRLVILGNTPSDGFPFIHDSHNAGSLIFGTDGTLLASCGESSATNSDPGSSETTFYDQALTDGILKSDDPFTPSVNENENVGSWRAQMVNCLSGKIIRIDPLTGNGVPSNPFYDASSPRAAKSRVWAMGLRNPFRMTLKPETGGHLPSEGNPGVIYVGDVGSFRKEEINIVTTGGQNFGWPHFEGIDETTGSVVPIPFERNEFDVSIYPINHTRPSVDYRGMPARAYVQSVMKEIGTTTPNAIPGIGFNGGCSIGGVFYTGSNFPSEYQGRYFHGNFNNSEDPTQNWIIGLTMNSSNELVESHSFLPNALGVTCMAINPINGYLYYTSQGVSLREVKYDLGNQPPTAKATQDKKYGVSPLTVQFGGGQSTDPESGTLSYLWDFGDGSPTSTSINPAHVFTNSNPIRYDVTLTVTDNQNQTNSTSLIVSVNNTPPVINSTTVENMDVYANINTISVALQAVITDNETPTSQLNFKWETSLHHNIHFHANPTNYTQSSSITMSPLPCGENETYFYQVKLTVTDAQGLSAERIKNIAPDCGQTYGDTEKPTTPTNLQLTGLTTTRISFSWTPSTDNVGVAMYEIFKNGVKIDESVTPSYSATGLLPSTFYLFKITAKDAAGNISSQSDGFGVYTADLVTQDEVIYGDALNGNWQNFSSILSMSLSNNIYPFINSRSIKINNPTFNEALILTYNGFPIDTTGYKDGLEFWVYNQGSTPFPFQVQAFANNSGGGGAILGLSANANKWSHFLLDWSILGNLSQVGKISFTLNQSQTQSIYFDEIKLVHCSYMYSVQSGNWNQSATWSCGRMPISTDDITISGGNTVTIPNGVSATLNFLNLIGTLNIQSGAIFDIKNF